jgi:hypothetical protein
VRTFPYGWSIGTGYKAKAIFEGVDHWNHTIDLAVVKRLSNIPIVLSAKLEKIRIKAVPRVSLKSHIAIVQRRVNF